jgi:hypothetical protein
MGMNFAAELEACGCVLSREELYELVQDVRVAMCPSWTVDELACNPQFAIRVCDEVRRRSQAEVPDNVIMHALMNARKRP